MEKTIKNFDSFVKKLWEEYSINFINSFSPNPIDFLDHLDDIVLEYLDDDYRFHSYFIIRKNYKDRTSYKISDGSGKTGHGWEVICSDLTFPQAKSFEDKFLIFDLWDNFSFKDLINSDNYRPIYRLTFYPKNKNQGLMEIMEDFCSPVTKRISNEFGLKQLYVNVVSHPDYWVFDDIDIDISDPKSKIYGTTGMPHQKRTGIDYLTIHLTL